MQVPLWIVVHQGNQWNSAKQNIWRYTYQLSSDNCEIFQNVTIDI